MTATCPNGHESTSSDYCDTCGVPIPPRARRGRRATRGRGRRWPGRRSRRAGCAGGPGAAEVPQLRVRQQRRRAVLRSVRLRLHHRHACRAHRTAAPAPLGLGATVDPAGARPSRVEWVAEVWVDPDWYAEQESEDPCPSPGLPVVVPLPQQSVLIGRPSVSRNIHPDVDCSGDTGVSRRQAQLTTDGQRWWVEDLQSSNGTYVGPASGPLPTAPVPPGQRRELAEDDRVYVGAWTRLVVRRATPEEQAGAAS